MPFDTVERSSKRIRADMSSHNDDDDNWYMHETTSTFEIYHTSKNDSDRNSPLLPQDWNKSYSPYDMNHYPYESSVLSSPPMDYMLPSTPATVPIDIPYSANSEYLESSISPQSNNFWQDDSQLPAFSPVVTEPIQSPKSLLADSLNNSSASMITDNPKFTDVLSKIQFSYSDVGINLEAKITNASDLRTLIDAFSHMCCSPSQTSPSQTSSPPTSLLSSSANVTQSSPIKDKMLLYRNKSNNTKPVNFFASTNRLGQLSNPHSSIRNVRQIVDACIDTFFTCWVRFKPILKRDEFMAWYNTQENPTDTLIVNAMCSYAFRHTVIHHSHPSLNHFLKDQDKLKEQEEYFFSQARECLSQSFDNPDRYTVIGLLFMSIRAEPLKRHHYAGMAASALHELEIYPRMVTEDVDSYEKELDTRLWWFVWAIDFSLWTAGAPKNTPQPRYPGEVDFPQVFEQDIDDAEIGVITFIHCLKLWRIQGDIVAALYDRENSELTVEQLTEYDRRLLDFHKALPQYLVFDSGFEYGCEDLFLACLRVNIEYNASRIILHKLFIPEMNDTRPSPTSLNSLNICLSTALTQLSAIKTCNMADVGRCAFDRDELWRAAEVISVAMDIYHTCVSPDDRAKIIRGIKMEDFTNGLGKSYAVLQNTREFRFSCKNWFQVADWIQVEIRRHQLGASYPVESQRQEEQVENNRPDYFLAQLKPNAMIKQETIQNEIRMSPVKTKSVTAASKQPRRSISFQNQFSVQQQPSSPNTSTFSINQQQQQNDRRPSFSTAPPFVQFNAYTPPDQTQTAHGSGKSQARFRYFNPRKMNKFLFIDEHPMM